MTLNVSIENLLWYLQQVFIVCLLLRLASQHIILKYKALAAYLAFSAAQSLLLIALTFQNPEYYRTRLYASIWVYSTPVLWLLSTLVALEIYGLVLEQYRGLSILSRRTLAIVLAVSAVGAVVAGSPSFDFTDEKYPILKVVSLLEQTVSLALFFFLLAIALFLLWYPVPLKRNIIVYSYGYSTLLFTIVAAHVIRNMLNVKYVRVASTGLLGVCAVCLALWLVLLNQRGESEVRSAALPRGAESEQRLLDQLGAFNALLESGRKS